MGMTFAFGWEIGLMAWLQAVLGGFGALFANVFSVFGEEVVLIGLMGFLYWCYDKKIGRILAANVCIGLLFNTMIKNVVVRRRPYMDHEEIKCLRPVKPGRDLQDIHAQGYSFPSGHSTNAVTAYGSLASVKEDKRIRILGVALPLLVGMARVVAGVHYPTDVLGGWLLGACVIVLMHFLEKNTSNRHLLHAWLLLAGIAGVFFCKSEDYYSSLGIAAGFFLADWLEERYVGFQNTRDIMTSIVRILGGVALFLGISYLLKMPFSEAFLDSGSTWALFARLGRYFIASFLVLGVYPLSFKHFGK